MAASNKADLSFDDMLRISRQKRENEKFAQSIFGRDRRSSAPSSLGKRRGDSVPSLASRVGIAKPAQRAKSSRDLKAKANTHTVRPSPLKQELANGGILASRVGSAPPTQPRAQNISIRGLAGPAVVMGSNFAPGTTAADIQSAMEPVGGQIQSCRIVTARPTVIAEMVFSDRSGAEAVIETFNNQKADGRLLHVYLKTGPGGQNVTTAARTVPAPAPQLLHSQTAPAVQDDYREYDQEDHRTGSGGHGARAGFNGAQQELDVEMDEHRDEREADRRYNDDRRAERREASRESRPYRPQNGFDRRYDHGSRDQRLYSDRMNYRGRGFQ